jgi:hypothetical protein
MRVPDTEFSPQEITKRWLWRLGLLFLLCLAALVATFIFWRVNLSRKIDRVIAAIQKDGYPISLTQLEDKYYPNIPSNENAAPFFLNAFASLHETNSAKLRIPDLPDYQSTNKPEFLSQTNLEYIATLLANAQETLALLHQSTPVANCRYPINLSLGLDMLLPHLGPLKSSAKLLSLEAIIRAKNGDAAASVDDLSAIVRLFRSLDHEPIFMSQVVRMSTEALAIKSLEYVLNSQSFSDAQLVQLSEAFRVPDHSLTIERAIVGDLCTGVHVFEMFGVGRQNLVLTKDSTGADPFKGKYGFLKLTGFFDRDYCFYLETMEEDLRIAKLPPREKMDAASKLENQVAKKTSGHYYLISGLILPTLRRPYAYQIGIDARLNIVQAVLAIERYRLANQNRLPDSLSNLVPSFLNSVPADPFDGKLLRYKQLAKGYLVYSVGEDGKDDGGVYVQPAQRLKPGAPSDITFVVER